MDHLDVVTSTFVSDPLTAGLTVALGRNGLEDVLDVWPGFLVTTGHQGGAESGTLLASGNTGADKSDALGAQLLGAAVRVGEVRVTTINDDVSLLQEGQKSLNPLIDGLSGLDEEHDTAGGLEAGNELLVVVGTDNGLALGLVFEEGIDLGNGSVVSADGEAVVSHVENQVLSPVAPDVSN